MPPVFFFSTMACVGSGPTVCVLYMRMSSYAVYRCVYGPEHAFVDRHASRIAAEPAGIKRLAVCEDTFIVFRGPEYSSMRSMRAVVCCVL